MSRTNSSLYSVNIAKLTRKIDIIKHLNELHTILSELGQEIGDRPKDLKFTAQQLVSPKLLSHSDKDVRLLSVCCIVDVLRVFAPEAPYNNEDTITVFEAITSQLHGLATHESAHIVSSQVYYILNSISTVQSCVVPVILEQSGVKGAEEVVVAMFEAILASVRPEHPEEVLAHGAAILHSCIEEAEKVSDDLLDVLLQPLLPSNKADNPTA
eukprot:CAMPEP_0173208958 /NCGR_PEP_ID=MMETSP1141-20130122/22822_1 /TAXON_ID=483371 /ORGANISM="non described non described, Strain CCMP2298" /LENGTH=211 /DNA_ID=CAMNT_0014135501 /DNA_START=122 /DNA_END=753 /DNA_ORIENTATION=+